uniref:Uncharacterized protein n=1 Tax=Hyaloperonospora arabidopsidis (strain Emoy2) TaxID=559515 RepID=M4BDD1_HYAAE
MPRSSQILYRCVSPGHQRRVPTGFSLSYERRFFVLAGGSSSTERKRHGGVFSDTCRCI